MRKIITLYKRDYEGTRLVYDEVVPGAEWVLAGEGVATRKWDGTCCMVREGKFYKRYEAKNGETPPAGFEVAEDQDPVTGHWPGWLPVGAGPEDKYHREAWERAGAALPDGTYELVGPKVQGGAEGFARHVLLRHGVDVLPDAPRTFDALKEYLSRMPIEGIVWHHPDGRMVKVKAKDFGIRRRAPQPS